MVFLLIAASKFGFIAVVIRKSKNASIIKQIFPPPQTIRQPIVKRVRFYLKNLFFSSSYQFTTICYYFAIKHVQKQQPSHAVQCRCSTFNIHTRRFVSKNIQTIKNCQRQEIKERDYNERKICETFLHFQTETKTQKRENNQISPIDKTCQL